MNHSGLFDEALAERARQNEKHPVSPKYLLHPKIDKTFRMIKELCKSFQSSNDKLEKNNEHSYYGLINEEVLEVFTAKTREERHIEIVQAIALLVRLDEDEAI